MKNYYKEAVKEYKEFLGNKCSQCGFDEDCNKLQFDHIDPNQKNFEISGRKANAKREQDRRKRLMKN
jgi:hypothetical protein